MATIQQGPVPVKTLAFAVPEDNFDIHEARANRLTIIRAEKEAARASLREMVHVLDPNGGYDSGFEADDEKEPGYRGKSRAAVREGARKEKGWKNCSKEGRKPGSWRVMEDYEEE